MPVFQQFVGINALVCFPFPAPQSKCDSYARLRSGLCVLLRHISPLTLPKQIYYSPSLFKSFGMDYNMQLILGGVLNVTQLVGVSTSLYTMDRFGRRPLLLIGSVCMTVAHVVIAVLVGLYYHDWTDHQTQGWVAVAFLFFYMLAFGCTYGPGTFSDTQVPGQKATTGIWFFQS